MGVHHHLLWFPPRDPSGSDRRGSAGRDVDGQHSAGPTEDQALAAFAWRWRGLVEVHDAVQLGLDPVAAGVEGSGAVLIRPDGFVGFRALPACRDAIAAIDAHLERWFIPS